LGFTLAELAVVLVLLGTILALVLPRFSGVTEDERLRQSVRRLTGLALEAHSQAVTQARSWFLCLDLDQKRSWLSTVRPGQEGEAGRETRYVSLLQGVSFEDVIHPTRGMIKEGRVEFGYWPRGGSEPGTIHVKNEGQQQITLFLRPYLGRVEIKEGYLREAIQ